MCDVDTGRLWRRSFWCVVVYMAPFSQSPWGQAWVTLCFPRFRPGLVQSVGHWVGGGGHCCAFKAPQMALPRFFLEFFSGHPAPPPYKGGDRGS